MTTAVRPQVPAAVLRSAAAVAGLAVVSVVLASVHVRRPETLCLLRATTGVPCPACGGTTAVVRLGRGDLVGAVAASPLAVLLGVWLVLAPWRDRVARRVPAGLRRPVVARTALVALVAGAEAWQLARHGLL
jgi:hypothetical protein